MSRLFKAEFVLLGAGAVTIGLAGLLGHWASVVGVLGVVLAGLLAGRPRTPSTAATLASIGVMVALAFLTDPIFVGSTLIVLGGAGLVFAGFERGRARGAGPPSR